MNEACAWLNSKEPIQKVVAHLTARYHNHDKPDEGINGANALVIGLAEALVTPLSEQVRLRSLDVAAGDEIKGYLATCRSL